MYGAPQSSAGERRGAPASGCSCAMAKRRLEKTPWARALQVIKLRSGRARHPATGRRPRLFLPRSPASSSSGGVCGRGALRPASRRFSRGRQRRSRPGRLVLVGGRPRQLSVPSEPPRGTRVAPEWGHHLQGHRRENKRGWPNGWACAAGGRGPAVPPTGRGPRAHLGQGGRHAASALVSSGRHAQITAGARAVTWASAFFATRRSPSRRLAS